MTDSEYDIIIAGAGLAGSTAASVAAKKGMNVLLLDRNPEPEVGKKTNWGWVCGDAVAASHLDFVTKNTGMTFSKPELDKKVDGVYAFSPDLESKYQFEGVGYILDRPEFETKLLKAAKDSGAHYIPQFEVEGPLTDGDKVVGIFGRDKDKQRKEYKAKVVIDALGMATVLRRRLPANNFVDKDINIDDVESTGRYIIEFDEPQTQDLNYYDPNNALIHLDQHMAPGGYGWVFPKSGNKVNIGLGVQGRSLKIRNEKLGRNDTLQSLIDAYIKHNPIFKNIRIFNKNNNGKGIWSVAVRRQLESLVYNGYMGAGDSMVMPNPLSAGGIGPALMSGILAGKNAAISIEEGDTSLKSLWKYNVEFNEAYGKKTAGLEVFRIYLQSLNNDVINYGVKKFLTTDEANELTLGAIPELSLASKFKMVLKGATNINAFRNLVYAVNKMKELNSLYEKYPESPDKYHEWLDVERKSIEEAKERFQPNPI